MPGDGLELRLAANEVRLREVNEGIERGQWPGERESPVGFRCECARLGCNHLVNLTLPEYEHVRANPRRFVMIPGHELPEVETVVETMAEYLVVEKVGRAGEKAHGEDPRSRRP